MKCEIKAWLNVRSIRRNILIYKRLRKNPNWESFSLSPKNVFFAGQYISLCIPQGEIEGFDHNVVRNYSLSWCKCYKTFLSGMVYLAYFASITTVSIMTFNANSECCYAKCHFCWVSQLSPLCWVSLCWMSFTLRVVMLNVIYAEYHN
jgi:hypothetical protein